MASDYKPFEATVGTTAAALTSGDAAKDAFIFDAVLVQFDDGASSNGNTGVLVLGTASTVTVTGATGGQIFRAGDSDVLFNVKLSSIFGIASVAGQKLRVTPRRGNIKVS